MWLLRVMTWISLHLGRPASRLVLHLITGYFLLSSRAARNASKDYLRRILGRPANWYHCYKHIFTFASTIHDRIYFINDRDELFDITVYNEAIIEEVLAEGRGAFLIGAHLGSFEVIRTLGRRQGGLRTIMVMHDNTARKINTILTAINPSLEQDILPLGRVDTMLQIYNRLNEGAVLSMLADRSLSYDQTVPVSLLGSSAAFPTGPFRMGALLQRPVIFMAGLHLGGNRYSVHFERLADFSQTPRVNREKEIRTAITRYASLVEQYCRLAPYNWFNFFDFWGQTPPR